VGRELEVSRNLMHYPAGTLLLDGWQVLWLDKYGRLYMKSIADFTVKPNATPGGK